MRLISKTLALFVIFPVFGGCALVVFGQQRRAKNGKHVVARSLAGKTSNDLSYSLQPFDPSIVSLPPHFRGNNAAEIYARLAKRQQSLRQGEFETSEVYRQRKQQELSKPLLGSLTQQGIFAFVVNNVESKYDADQQILHVRAKLSNVIEGVTFRNKTLALPWLKVSRDMGSYIGTNAFGARIRVDRAVVDSYVIAFDNYQQFYQQPRIERSETASDYLRDKKEQVLWEQTLSDQMF